MTKERNLVERIAHRYWGGDALGPNYVVGPKEEEIRRIFASDSGLLKVYRALIGTDEDLEREALRIIIEWMGED